MKTTVLFVLILLGYLVTVTGSSLPQIPTRGSFPVPDTTEGEPGIESGSLDSACLEDTNRQFDFWVGDWDVFISGEKSAKSRIERTLGGCLIVENYENLKNGYQGKSMNFYDVKQGKWIQIWTDIAGNISRYTGQMKNGKMYFNGTNLSRDGSESLVRMEFTPNADGTVRQIYENSTDNGKIWNILFDGIYKPAGDQ